MKYGDLLINGVRLDSINIENMDNQTLWAHVDAAWAAVKLKLGDAFERRKDFEETFGADYWSRIAGVSDRHTAERKAAEAAKEMAEPIEIDSIVYHKLSKFRILHDGWELDNLGWIVSSGGKDHQIILTNHGQEYVAGRAELEAKIAEYQAAIDATKAVLSLLDEG